MLEIIIVWRLAKHIGILATQKSLKKLGYQIMAVLLWLCGEFFGGILGNIIFGANGSFWLKYVAALFGAIAGAGIAFLVMRLLPKQELPSNSSDTEKKQETSPMKKFGRSVWVPILVILLAFSCLCTGFGGALIIQMRSVVQQIHASNPVIGIKINSSGRIIQPVNEFSSKENAVYFGFNYEIPQGGELPITFDWYIDGHIAYSFEKTLGQGQVVVALDRNEFGMSEFNKGNYEVVAHIGELFLTSAKFVVK